MPQFEIHIRRLILLGICCLLSFMSIAQDKQIPDNILENILAQIAENKEQENIDESLLYDDLQYFLENPINLNHTNKEELERLHFLTSIQIENLLYYLYMYFPMETVYELQLVEGLYGQDIRNLLPFIRVNKTEQSAPPLKWKSIIRYNKQELICRTDRTLEQKKGYRKLSDTELAENPNQEYLGSPYYHNLKYRFRYSNRIYAGFTADKDAGEQLWNKGTDFYSAHLQINEIGKFKTIVIGDYGASFGQGLLLNTDFGFGKSSMVCNTEAQARGLYKYSSSNEYNFFRGAGATLRLKNVEVSAFYSNRQIDGDTISHQFASIKEDGLHRTVNELAKKNTVNLQLMGAHASVKFSKLHIGFTGVHLWMDNALIPNPQPYNYYYFSGKEQAAFSCNYKFRWRNISGFGETALTDQHAWASLNGINFSPASSLNLSLLHRYYAKDYDVLFANAFAESSRINNEEGFYMAAELQATQSIKFSAYADTYRFPWLKFGIDKPSDGYDILFQTDYSPQRDLSMYARFRFEQKQDNMAKENTITPDIANYDRASLRYVIQHTVSDNLNLKNTLETSYSQKGDEKQNWGWLLSQDLSYKLPNYPLSMDFRYEFFDAMNYENRIYSYEKDVLYAFSIPVLYGKGNRYYINLKYKALENLTLYFKIAQTIYFGKETNGSALEEIEGNRKTDVRLVIKYGLR